MVEAQTQTSDSDETYSNATLGTTQPTLPGEHKVLGVRWEIRSDHLCFGFEDIAHLAMSLEPMIRNLVSVVGRFYDPIRYLSLIVIRFNSRIVQRKAGLGSAPDWRVPTEMEQPHSRVKVQFNHVPTSLLVDGTAH